LFPPKRIVVGFSGPQRGGGGGFSPYFDTTRWASPFSGDRLYVAVVPFRSPGGAVSSGYNPKQNPLFNGFFPRFSFNFGRVFLCSRFGLHFTNFDIAPPFFFSIFSNTREPHRWARGSVPAVFLSASRPIQVAICFPWSKPRLTGGVLGFFGVLFGLSFSFLQPFLNVFQFFFPKPGLDPQQPHNIYPPKLAFFGDSTFPQKPPWAKDIPGFGGPFQTRVWAPPGCSPW